MQERNQGFGASGFSDAFASLVGFFLSMKRRIAFASLSLMVITCRTSRNFRSVGVNMQSTSLNRFSIPLLLNVLAVLVSLGRGDPRGFYPHVSLSLERCMVGSHDPSPSARVACNA
jgi:hypothetical protein